LLVEALKVYFLAYCGVRFYGLGAGAKKFSKKSKKKFGGSETLSTFAARFKNGKVL
jgi:hypothetical protein